MGAERATCQISVVVPVYQGEKTLEALLAEVEPLVSPQPTPGGYSFQINEVILVHDGASDRSGEVMRALAARLPFVRLIWLSRNFGQHAATLAGMASTVCEWVATLDEDGQQDPRDLGQLLDEALCKDVQLVYARPSNVPPHGWLRNTASRITKWIFVTVLGNRALGNFNSFRLIRGELARGVAAYCGERVYLDVALSWVVGRTSHVRVALRNERGRPSGYNLPRLLKHFWNLVLTSGTRPLRAVSATGVMALLAGMVMSGFVVYEKLTNGIPVQGWTSLVIVVSLFSGLILISLGVIAEYLGIAVWMAMGKPPYLIVSREVGSRCVPEHQPAPQNESTVVKEH